MLLFIPRLTIKATFAQILYMTNDQIEKQLKTLPEAKKVFRIHFKTRNSMLGMFINTGDYDDLKSKNFWRIVTGANIEIWTKSKDMNLPRIFNGSEFTRLSLD
jgi:hypothetical protein